MQLKQTQTRKALVTRRTMTTKARLANLRAFVRICFGVMGLNDLKEVANLTKLSVPTLRRVQTKKLTLCVRYGTIEAIGLAAGLRLVKSDIGYRIAVVK